MNGGSEMEWQDDPEDRAPMTEAIDAVEEFRRRVAELEADNARLITLAAAAIGTDPEHHSAGCVEALVQYHETVKEDNERLSAALESKQQEVNNAMEMFFKEQAENDRLRKALSIAWDFRCEWHDCRRWTHKVNDDFCYFHKAIFETYGINKAALKEVDGELSKKT